MQLSVAKIYKSAWLLFEVFYAIISAENDKERSFHYETA
jgi:hypothetical protein